MQQFKTAFPAKCLYIRMRVFMSLISYMVRISCLATVPICKKLTALLSIPVRLLNVLQDVFRNLRLLRL
jgi:hypothetical protein